jgi:hypothetical protein
MATLLLTAVGTAIGGPIGGAIGAFVGRQADQAVFGSGSREGPRLKELSVTTSSYGQPMPRNFGRMRVAGTIIWSTDLQETRNRGGGGKGQPSVSTYSYSASFAVALTSTPISRLGRIWADGNLLRGASGDLKVPGAMRFYNGTGDSHVDPLIAAEREGLAPAFRDCAYIVFEDLQLADFGNRIPALTFEVFGSDDHSVGIDQLVPGAASDAGSRILQDSRGFLDEGGALASTLSIINRVYPLVCSTDADGLRVGSAYRTDGIPPLLPEQLAISGNSKSDKHFRQRGTPGTVEPLALRYYDEDRDYQPSVQRALGMRPDGRKDIVDLPSAMTSEGARSLANTNAQRARWGNERQVWSIGELDYRIVPGAIVRLPGASGYWLIKSWEWSHEGIELELDRVPPLLVGTSASDPGSSSTPSDQINSPTLLHATELPPEDGASPSSTSIFAAVSSSGQGWRRAALYVEQGPSLESIGVAGSDRAVIGSLQQPVGASSCAILEPGAFIIIDVAAPDLFFSATDVVGLAMGANRLLVGGEVIQFLDAVQMEGARWKLTGLLRGRAGTEDAACLGHDAGTAVVLIDDRLTPLDSSEVPSSQDTRIAAIGIADEEPVCASLANAGLSRRPPLPVSPRTRSEPDGSVRFCWTRRARGYWRWTDSPAVPLVEENEFYTVGYGDCDAPFEAWNTQKPEFVLTPNHQLDLVADHGSAPLWVRQIGTFGISSPLLLSILS